MRVPGAFILARYSTDNQNADSIEVQVGKCTEWCNANSVPILGIYADYAVSGMKDTRPQYEAMMTALRSGQADTVVIYDQSRMFRKLTAWFEFRDELERMGVRVVSVTQPLVGGDLRDPANFINEGVTALFNQMWALQTRQKVVEKMRHMAQTGQHTGGKPPLGYRLEDGTLIPDEREAPIVRRIFAEYAAGRSYKQIIDGLNADGLRTKRGNPFGTNSLHDLLHNEKYIGVLTYGKAVTRSDGSRNTHTGDHSGIIRIENAHAAIVDPETFTRVQERMTKNKGAGGGAPPRKRDYPLKGKVFCGECGAPLVVNTCSRVYDYYKCNDRKRTHQCDNKPIRVDILEKICADLVRQTLGEPAMTDRLLAELRAAANDIQTGAAARLAVIIDQQREISTQLNNAVEAVLSGLNSPALKSRIHDLESQQAALDHEAKALRRQVDATSIPEQHIRQILQTILDTPDGDPALLSIITRVEVSSTNITVYTAFDPDRSKTDYTQPGTSITPSTEPRPDSATGPADALTTTAGFPSAPPLVIVTPQYLRITIPR